MTIAKNVEGSKMTIALEGRLDTTTTPALDVEMKALPTDITELNFDFEKLAYVSSAGLRVILGFQKKMNKQGSMKLYNVSAAIMEVFEVTGFSGILTVNP